MSQRVFKPVKDEILAYQIYEAPGKYLSKRNLAIKVHARVGLEKDEKQYFSTENTSLVIGN